MLPKLDAQFDWYRTRIKTLTNQELLIYFRGLTRREYTQYLTKKNNNDEEGVEYLLKTAIHNYNPYDILYGYGIKLIKEIETRSVSPDADIPMNEAKGWIDTEMGSIEADAVCFIPGLSLEMLDSCKPSNYFKYLIMGQRLKASLYAAPPPSNNNDLTMQQAIVPPSPGQSGAEITQFSWSRS